VVIGIPFVPVDGSERDSAPGSVESGALS